MTRADLFFDFVSPFTYFAVLKLAALEDRIALRYRPILFATVLDHLGQKAPVDIPAKRGDVPARHLAFWRGREVAP